MKDVMAALNPMRNPVYASWERLNHRLIDTALRDPWFLQLSGGMMQAMLQQQKLYNQWLGTVTGASRAVPDMSAVDAMKQALADLEARVQGVVQRSKKEGA